MPTLLSLPPGLAPLIGCSLALCSLWIGWRTLRTLTIPPLLKPAVQLSTTLVETMRGESAARHRAEPLPMETIRAYGWAWIYTGTLVLIVAGGQLVRLVCGALR